MPRARGARPLSGGVHAGRFRATWTWVSSDAPGCISTPPASAASPQRRAARPAPPGTWSIATRTASGSATAGVPAAIRRACASASSAASSSGQQRRAALRQLALLPRLVLLALGALVGRRLPGRRVDPLGGPGVIGRQGTIRVVENAPKDLRVVPGGLGGLVAKGQQILGLLPPMRRQQRRGLRQFFGRGCHLGAPVKALIKLLHERCRLGMRGRSAVGAGLAGVSGSMRARRSAGSASSGRGRAVSPPGWRRNAAYSARALGPGV